MRFCASYVILNSQNLHPMIFPTLKLRCVKVCSSKTEKKNSHRINYGNRNLSHTRINLKCIKLKIACSGADVSVVIA